MDVATRKWLGCDGWKATEPYIEYISFLPPSQAEDLSFPLQEERPPLPSLTTKVEAFKVQYTSSRVVDIMSLVPRLPPCALAKINGETNPPDVGRARERGYM